MRKAISVIVISLGLVFSATPLASAATAPLPNPCADYPDANDCPEDAVQYVEPWYYHYLDQFQRAEALRAKLVHKRAQVRHLRATLAGQG